MVFNATFNNISALSWQSVLVVYICIYILFIEVAKKKKICKYLRTCYTYINV